MGVTITCKKCGQTDRYSSSEILNKGTRLKPIYAVQCRYCKEIYIENNTLSSSKENRIEFPKKTREEVVNELESLLVKRRFPEFILQRYFSEEYKYYGFSHLEGPFPRGPDFTVTRDKKIIELELETDEYNFIRHEHHKSKAFKKVGILVYLTHNPKVDNFPRSIPKERMQLDKEHFMEWYWIKNEQNVFADNLYFRIDLVFNEFVAIYLETICDKKDSDMSVCPQCLNCGYFSKEIVQGFTNKYLKKHIEILTLNDYDFSLITRESVLESIND